MGELGINKVGYVTFITAIIFQIAATIINDRYQTCIMHKAKMYSFAYHLSEIHNNSEYLETRTISDHSFAEILEIMDSRIIKEGQTHALRHIDSSILDRLWLELYNILNEINKKQKSLTIKSKDINLVIKCFNHLCTGNSLDSTDYLALKRASIKIKTAMNRALDTSKPLLAQIMCLWQIVNELSKENIYGSLRIISDEYSRTLEGAKQLELDRNNLNYFTYKAIQWAIFTEHKRNSEDMSLIEILRTRSFIFQTLSAILFSLACIFLIIAIKNNNQSRKNLHIPQK